MSGKAAPTGYDFPLSSHWNDTVVVASSIRPFLLLWFALLCTQTAKRPACRSDLAGSYMVPTSCTLKCHLLLLDLFFLFFVMLFWWWFFLYTLRVVTSTFAAVGVVSGTQPFWNRTPASGMEGHSSLRVVLESGNTGPGPSWLVKIQESLSVQCQCHSRY